MHGVLAVEANSIVKRYGAITALDGASLALPKGKVTALVGDNGAGKSSLVKVISGVVRPDSGTLRVGGEKVEIANPRMARGCGIHTVFQDLALVGPLDVVENCFLGDEVYWRMGPVKLPFLNRFHMAQVTRQALDRLDATTVQDLSQPVEVLSGGQRQTVAIARAVRQEARLLILDEPTAALGVKQATQVLKAVEQLRDGGTAILIISHNLREVFAVSDYVAVMLHGRVVRTFDRRETTEEEVVSAIVGLDRNDPINSVQREASR
ncbi:ABC transporter ATP-binding protein [Phyllobacterium sophorae]|uniref:ABC transporter ATP-binding protein n=2 Tax=Phyllobacterium sophorae TaxID=1520277 RepID=A0A2P7B715_9HYPH|nr:ABC transporter ATP-binding protein [Phyllobacterium sophorae]